MSEIGAYGGYETVRVEQLVKYYRKKLAVNHLDLTMNSQECLGFIGPNGAGKSTTVKLISGYSRKSSGQIILLGMNLDDEIETIRLQFGICPQDNILWDDLTAKEHLLFFARIKGLHGRELKESVKAWLEKVKLTAVRNKPSKHYSGGMKRRLCVAIAMVASPHIVLLDEPTTGLDPDSKSNLWDVILEFKKQSSLLLTTHSMEEAERLCDRIGIFIDGQLSVVGTADELTASYGKGYKLVINANSIKSEEKRSEVNQFISQIPNSELLPSTRGSNQTYELEKDTKLSQLFHEINSKDLDRNIEVSNTNLEEVFIYHVNKASNNTNVSSDSLKVEI